MNGQQDKNTQHNAEKIIRYLSGKMGREENHAFERAMVDDDLLADAVEGYQLMRETISDEEILAKAEKIATRPVKKEENKAAIISFARFRWVAYAVAAFLVVGAGWFIFNLSQRETSLPGEHDNQKALVQSAEKTPEANPGDRHKAAEGISSDTFASKTATKIPDVAKSEGDKPITEEINKTPQSSNRALADQTEANKTAPSVSSLVKEDSAEGKAASSKRKMVANIKIDPVALLNVKAIDTAEAIPADGWVSYTAFLGKTLPKNAGNLVSRAIISMEASGKVSQVRVEGKLSPSDKKTTENAILNGPGWKTKTGRAAKAIFEWQ